MNDLPSQSGPFTVRLLGPDHTDRKTFTHYKDALNFALGQLNSLEGEIEEAAILGPVGDLRWQKKATPIKTNAPFPSELWCRTCQKIVTYKINCSRTASFSLDCSDCNEGIRRFSFLDYVPSELRAKVELPRKRKLYD